MEIVTTKMVLYFYLILLVVVATAEDTIEYTYLRRSTRTDQFDERYLATCSQPEFAEDWEIMTPHPERLVEANGGFIGEDLVITGGFLPGFTEVSKSTYYYKGGSSSNSFIKVDDHPNTAGVTHAGMAIDADGNKMYLCGGYEGGYPGPDIANCYVYDHSAPIGSRWSTFPSLPEPRAGGGMVYNSESDSLIFAGGAIWPSAGSADAIDKQDAWEISLDDPTGGWVAIDNIPYAANHISYITAVDGNGKERQYFLGGQEEENEKNGNKDDLVEYDTSSQSWISRQSMPFPRGHATSSTTKYGCGFIVTGGAINGGAQKLSTSDISYYSIPTDSWTKLGDLLLPIKGLVCSVYDNYLYCTTGTGRSWRRRLQFTNTVLTPVPTTTATQPPSIAPATAAPISISVPTTSPISTTAPTTAPVMSSPVSLPNESPSTASPTTIAPVLDTSAPTGAPDTSPSSAPTDENLIVQGSNCLSQWECSGLLGLVNGYTMHFNVLGGLVGEALCLELCIASGLVSINDFIGWECGAC